MSFRNSPRKLAIIIPPSPTSAQTGTETAVDESKPYSQFTYQPYCSPLSPLKHPYRPRTNGTTGRSEIASKFEAIPPKESNFSLNAEDIASRDLLAVANLMTSMKKTLDRMTLAFSALGEQSQRLSSLPTEVKRAEEIRAAKVELEEQIERQKARMRELRIRLEGDVRAALENKLRERLATTIRECVANEVKERVRRELAAQAPLQLRDELRLNSDISQIGQRIEHEEEYQSDPDTPLLSPEDYQVGHFPKIPILLFHGPTDEEDDYAALRGGQAGVKTELNSPLFSRHDDSYPPVKMPMMLFDESQVHEPPPPSPIPMAGPLRPLLRPLPTPEQSPAYVVHSTLPSRCASGCATPITAYPGVPAPTPITNEPIIVVYPLKSAPVSALSPVSEGTSPLGPRDINLLFALSSERNKELLKNQDLDGFVVPTPMSEWPKVRTIIKTPARSARSSPLMVPPPLEPKFMSTLEPSDHRDHDLAPPEAPVLLVPPPRPSLRARSTSFAKNLKLLPPLIIS